MTLIDKYILSCMVFIIRGLITDAKALLIFQCICFHIALLAFLLLTSYFAYLFLRYRNEAKDKEEKNTANYKELNRK